MTDLRELEKRLEEATGPDRELDAAIFNACPDPTYPQTAFSEQSCIKQREWGREPRFHDGWFVRRADRVMDKFPGDLPRLTRSLDAAVALVERVLPDAFPTIDRYSISDEPTAAQYNWRVWIKWVEGDDAIREAFSGTKSSPALALCLALIRALIAKGDRHD